MENYQIDSSQVVGQQDKVADADDANDMHSDDSSKTQEWQHLSSDSEDERPPLPGEFGNIKFTYFSVTELLLPEVETHYAYDSRISKTQVTFGARVLW